MVEKIYEISVLVSFILSGIVDKVACIFTTIEFFEWISLVLILQHLSFFGKAAVYTLSLSFILH